MKKTIILSSVFALVAMAPLASQASDGTITFAGALTAVTCSVHGGAPGAANGSFTVTLPTLPTSKLTAAAQTDGATGYNIFVGAVGEAACTNGQHASIHYDAASTQIDPATGRLNTLTGGAANVQLQILDAAVSPAAVVNLFTGTNTTPVVIANNQATLPQIVRYFATGATTAGAVSSNVNYTVAFN